MLLIESALLCPAAGMDFFAFTVPPPAPPDIRGRAPCPLCGKSLILRPDALGLRRFIPNHHAT